MFNLKLNITGESTGTPGGVPHGPDEGLPVQSPDSHRSPSGVSRESPGSPSGVPREYTGITTVEYAPKAAVIKSPNHHDDGVFKLRETLSC